MTTPAVTPDTGAEASGAGARQAAPAESHGQSGRYYAALDGLRAVAVISVLLYHGGVAGLPGGFLGVDVFFVLSGFLITGLLLGEWERSDRLDLRQFWLRRARRLLPALFLVVGATAIAAIVVGGAAAGAIRGDGLAALLYVSNWWFIAQGASYDTAFSVPSPMLHTWSLAIEEQWYLLLPLALLIVLPLVGLRRRPLAIAFVGLAVLSALWMAYLAPGEGVDPSRVYFGTDTRIQALLLGGALAAVAPTLGRIPGRAIAAAGGALLVLAAMVTLDFDTTWLYRGGFLLVAAAVALVIADVTAAPSGRLARVLSVRPLVAVGKISYGLYLWHWPIYVFCNGAATGLSGLPLLLLRLSLTFALATASYFLIEMPIRRGALGRMRPFRRTALIVGSVATVLALLVVAPRLGGATAAAEADEAWLQAQARANELRANSPRVVLAGDSQALALAQLYPTDKLGLQVSPLLEFGCGLVPYDADIDGERMTVPAACATWGQEFAGRVGAAAPDVGVLFAGSWEQYDRWTPDGAIGYTDPRWHDALVQAYGERLAALHDASGTVALVLNSCHGVPEWDLPLETQFRAGRYPPVINDTARIEAVNRAAREAAREQPFPVRVIDLNPVICPDGYTEQVDGVQVRTDGLHVSEDGAQLVWDFLDPKLRQLADATSE